jgi:hypothetical protein
VEFGCNDGERHGSSGKAMDGISKGESSMRSRVHTGRGGAGGHIVSGSNEQRSRRHGKDSQDLGEIKDVVERRHQRTKKDGREREKEKTELGPGCPGTGRDPEVDPAVQERYVERLLVQP